MNKKIFFISLVSVLFITTVIAGVFYLTSFNFSYAVEEPFTIEYYWADTPTQNCNSTLADANYQSFSLQTITTPRTLYPGNNERICFSINSLANGNIPLIVEVNFTGVDTYDINFNPEMFQGDNYGSVDFHIAGDSDGTFNSLIRFGRGN